MITIIDGKKRIPFMRGMLIHYLIERGFPHKQAYLTAEAVRAALARRRQVNKKEITGIIERVIRRHGGQRLEGDLVFWERLPSSILVERKGHSRPFSKEVLSHSIRALGLVQEQAHGLAARIESRLIEQRRNLISHLQLEKLAVGMLSEGYGAEYAQRYWVWRALVDLDKPLIVLIGGASGVGKTTLAVSLANVLNIPRVVSTDDIRQIMRLVLSSELAPAIHTSSYAVSSRMPIPPVGRRAPVIIGFQEQVKVIGVGIKAILDRCLEENTSVIINGVHVLSDFVDLGAYADSAFVVPVLLTLKDRRLYQERFAQRSASAPDRPMHRYLVYLDQILQIQRYLVNYSKKHGIPVIDTGDVEDVTGATAAAVAEKLRERRDIRRILADKNRQHRQVAEKKRGGKPVTAFPRSE